MTTALTFATEFRTLLRGTAPGGGFGIVGCVGLVT
jgi:hypothetical protein